MTAKTSDPTIPSRPVDCILVKDETPESDEAERLLRDAGIHFYAVPPGHWGKKGGKQGFELQTIEYGNIQTGIQGVRAYLAALRIRARGFI